ncbi:MAG TPA: hypothetical protein VET69_10170, partial [Terriglobales bacterium]|nr:hypothetical protein [Terriglobales bacterium]
FSYTKSGQPWFAWEWLWDVAFAWLHQHWGLAAVALGSLLVISLTSVLLFRLTCRKSGNPLMAMAVTFLAVAGSSIHFLARPHLFTLLLFVIFYFLLERVKESGSHKLLMWLPAMTVLWTNLHGGFFVGIALTGLYAAGELTGALVEEKQRAWRPALARARPYALTALVCLAASLIGPYTWRLHAHIFEYLTDSFQREHIMEMLPISFQNPAARYFEILLLAGVAAAFWHLKRKRYTECFVLLFWGHLALIASRNIPLFGIAAAPVLGLALAEWLEALQEAPVAGWLKRGARSLNGLAASVNGMERIPRLHLVSLATMALVAAVFYAPAPPPAFRAVFNSKAFPAKALASIGGAQAQGRIFTSDQWGDFLIYNLYPRNRVFIDGRSDFYGSKFVQKYLDIVNVKYCWQRLLDDYGVDTVLLQADAPLAGALKESSRWRVVYDDGAAIVFRTGKSAENAQVSAVTDGGKARDRKVTAAEPRDRTITKTTT